MTQPPVSPSGHHVTASSPSLALRIHISLKGWSVLNWLRQLNSVLRFRRSLQSESDLHGDHVHQSVCDVVSQTTQSVRFPQTRYSSYFDLRANLYGDRRTLLTHLHELPVFSVRPESNSTRHNRSAIDGAQRWQVPVQPQCLAGTVRRCDSRQARGVLLQAQCALHQLNCLTLLLLYVFHCAMRFKQTKQRYEFRFLTVSVQLHRHIFFHHPQV